MPSHHGIRISLHSQFDATPIPELIFASSPTAPAREEYDHSTLTVLVPSKPSSQFWLEYVCPDPARHPASLHDTQFWFFKLRTRGSCVLSWGVGADDDWRGKVVCGFFDAGIDEAGRAFVEKRGLFFPPVGALGDGEGPVGPPAEGFLVEVFRAKGRRREEVGYEYFGDVVGGEGRGEGADMTTIGRKHGGERQRMYTYALVDAKDEPFVTFKYQLCTEEHFDQMRRPDSSQDGYDGELCSPISPMTIPIALSPSLTRPNRHHSSQPSSLLDRCTNSFLDNGLTLSIPHLAPTTSATSHASPVKQPHPTSHPEEPRHQRHRSDSPHITLTSPNMTTIDCPFERSSAIRTPSPSPSLSDSAGSLTVSPGTPPSQRKSVTSGLLRGVVASAFRRREGRESG